MLGLLFKIGLPALSFVGRLLGVHLFKNHLSGLGIGTIQSLAEGLGWRFIAGLASSLYLSNTKFRAGIDEAIGSIF